MEHQQRQRQLKELQEEKESMIFARNLLQQQKEQSSRPNASNNPLEEWYVVPRQDES